jgi:hypothetical protein
LDLALPLRREARSARSANPAASTDSENLLARCDAPSHIGTPRAQLCSEQSMALASKPVQPLKERTQMTTLLIKDLSMSELLAPAHMAAVQGGMINLDRLTPPPADQGGPAGANVPAIWNSGVDGPIIIWNRG